MSVVPVLDLRPKEDPRHILPSNIEAEQALLGILLYDNDAFPFVPDQLDETSFFEPFHGRLFATIAAACRAGYLAEAITVGEGLRRDPAFIQLGGLRYLADLVDRAPPSTAAASYGRVIVEMAQRRELIAMADQIAAAARDDYEGDGVTSIIEQAEGHLLAMAVHGRRGGVVSLDRAVGHVLDFLDNPADTAGVHTGLRPLDLQIGPMLPGDLILGAGRPSMGKSAIGLCMALNIAAPALAASMNGFDVDDATPKPAGVIQIHGEMTWGDVRTGGQTVRRHLCDVGFHLFGARFPTYKALRERKFTSEQRAMVGVAAGYLRELPVVGIKRTGITLSGLRSIVRRKAMEWRRRGIPLGLVLVDHVGLLKGNGGFRQSRYEEQTELAIGMKELAGEIDAPILALVQLSRDVERRDDKRPMLADLRDSGAWEENADVVWLAYRDAYYAAREVEPDATQKPDAWAKWDKRKRSAEIELILAKIREGDAGNTARLWGSLAWNVVRGSEPNPLMMSI